jgi:hypothetical protein
MRVDVMNDRMLLILNISLSDQRLATGRGHRFDRMVYISDIQSFTTSTLMMEAEQIAETSVFNSTLTRLIVREDF